MNIINFINFYTESFGNKKYIDTSHVDDDVEDILLYLMDYGVSITITKCLYISDQNNSYRSKIKINNQLGVSYLDRYDMKSVFGTETYHDEIILQVSLMKLYL